MEKTSLAEKSTIKKDASLPFYNPVMEGKKRAKKDSAYASGAWTKEEENRLSEAIKTFGTGDWMAVSNYVGTRNNKQCAQKWTQQMTPKTTGPWTAEEDYLLRQAVERCNTLEDSKVWSTICKSIPGRTNKQCRERWEEHLKPGINKGPWSPEEDALLLSLYSKLGTKWCKFIPSFKGRTQNFIKTRCILLLKGRKDGAADLPSSSQLKEKNSSLYQPNSTTTSIKHSHHPPPTETNVSLEGSAARATSPLAETSPLEGATYPMTSANPFISSSSMKQQATENVGSVFENPGLGSTTRKRPNSFLSKSYAKNASQGSKTLVDLNAPLNNPFSTYGSCNEGSNSSDPSHVQGSLGLSSTPLSPSNASMINGFLPKNSYTSERRGMNDSPNSSINGSNRSVDNQVSYFTEPSFGGNDAKPPISNINFLNAESKSPSIHSLSEVPLSLQSIPSISSMDMSLPAQSHDLANEVDDTSFLFFPHPAPSIDSEIMNVINNNNNNYSGNTSSSFNPPAPSDASNNLSTFEMNNPLYNSFNIMSNTDMNDYSTSNGDNHGLFTETNYGQMEMEMPYSQQSNGNMNSDYLNAYDSYGPPESKRMNNSNQDLFQPLEGVHSDYMNEPNQSYYNRGYNYPGDSSSINGNTYNNAGVTNNMFFSDYPEEAQPIFTNQDFAIEKITHGNDVNEEDNLSDLDDFGIF